MKIHGSLFLAFSSRRIRAIRGLVLLVAVLTLGSFIALARRDVGASSFEKAERLRDALEGRSESQRTRAQYNRVLDAFRAIYHEDPGSTRADASISAVAGLLAEEGRIFEDAKALNDAVAEYEFLRREYPGSRYRFSGLLTVGEIYRRDLGDRTAAKSVFQTFLRLYPRNALGEQARQELGQIQVEEALEKSAALHAAVGSRHIKHPSPVSPESVSIPAGRQEARVARKNPAALAEEADGMIVDTPGSSADVAPSLTSHESTSHATTSRPVAPDVTKPHVSPRFSSVPSNQAAGLPDPSAAEAVIKSTPEPVKAEQSAAVLNASPPPRRGRLPLVTGVRHWSTPVYTRVAIDLQDEVQYEAARVPNPDRIFFDLHGARLSPELIGKSVQVTDDGFLKRIRVAQYSSDVSRVVLDVSDVSDYAAFLLPNPYRLIIDIHGRKGPPVNSGGPLADSQLSATTPAGHGGEDRAGLVSSSAKSKAQISPTQTPRVRAASSGASNDVAGKSETDVASAVNAATSLQDVASLGRQPNRIKATRHPTTAPISASVAGATAAPQPDDGRTMESQASSAAATGKKSQRTRTQEPSSIHEAEPIAGGGRSLSRALGLKIGRIVVDAGHGGHDSGTLGPDGIEEKDVVLDVALRLGKLLRKRLGADVIFTRDDDTFIPLETRTAIANKAQADLFISVHANSSQDPDARGVETYYLSFTSSADALEVAARENAVSQQSIHELAGLVKKIALQDKIDESREFATDVERSLYAGLTTGQSQNAGLHDRGVKKAPFVVLIGANMPSILAEISFLTNPDDARQLRDPSYRQKISDSLYLGVARYVGGLSGVRLAANGGSR